MIYAAGTTRFFSSLPRHSEGVEAFYRAAITPRKAAKKPPKDLSALPAPPVKDTTPLVTPVALAAADTGDPLVPGTYKDCVPVGYGGTRPLRGGEEFTEKIEPRVLAEEDRLLKVVIPGYTAATQDTDTTF